MDIGLNHFVYDRKSIHHILRDNQTLGAHTNIVEIRKNTITTFKWTHPGVRPMGEPITKQCQACMRLRTKSPIVSNSLKVQLRCSGCGMSDIYEFPAGWKWVDGPPSKADE